MKLSSLVEATLRSFKSDSLKLAPRSISLELTLERVLTLEDQMPNLLSLWDPSKENLILDKRAKAY